jgi:hypothetical protein
MALLPFVLALALGGDSAVASTPLRQVHLSAGITLQLPAGWRILQRPITGCYDPVERLVAATFPDSRLGTQNAIPKGGALVLVLEDHTNAASGFPLRPKQFQLPAKPGLLGGCCGIPNGPGYEFIFHTHGRDFEVFVYGGGNAPANLVEQAISVLNSLRAQRVVAQLRAEEKIY